MNVKELKNKIENLPDNMEVFIAERKTDFYYGLVNSVYVKKIEFKEDTDPESPVLAVDKCLIIDEL